MDKAKLTSLLKTCEVTDEDIKSEISRIEEAFGRAGLKDEHLETAQANTLKYFRSAGSRKAMGHWIKRYTDAALAHDEGKKLAYHVHPGKPRFNMALLYATGAPKGNIIAEFIDSVVIQVFKDYF